MNTIARKALDIADQLWEVVDMIESDDADARSIDEYGRGYISRDELNVLNDAITILQEYGRGRSNESFVDEYEAYK